MKRNWDQIRKIMLMIEDLPPDNVTTLYSSNFCIEKDGINEEEASYYMHLLYEEGLIEATDSILLDGKRIVIAQSLTWEGHEFLDSIRPETTWEKIKQKADQEGLGLTFEAIKYLANFFLMKIKKDT